MERNLKVSIITACFNSEATLADSIKSVNSQTYGNVEHIFVDGGSSDGTLKIIKEVSERHFKVVQDLRSGVYPALNKGISEASGEIIGFVHSDDFLCHESVLENIVAVLDEPRISGVYGDLQYVNRSMPDYIERNWKAGKINKNSLKRGWMPPHPTLYLKKHVYEALGYFNTHYQISADYEFILRVFKNEKIKIEYIPEVLVKMRSGGISNRSLSNLFEKSQEDLKAVRSAGIGGIDVVALKNLRKLGQLRLTK